MGFHKRYISDEQVLEIYAVGKSQGVIDWFTRGVDAVITSGDLSDKIYTVLSGTRNDEQKLKYITELIDRARQNSKTI